MTLSWADLTADVTSTYRRIKMRFPHLDESAIAFLHHGRARFEAHLAATHQLTPTEAREEFADFLYIEALSRELGP